MPIFKKTLDFYTCKFKCHAPAMVLWKMEKHEDRCFCNPDNKSCRVCKFCKRELDDLVCEKHSFSFNRVNNNVNDYNTGETLWVADNDPFNPIPRPFPRSKCPDFVYNGKKSY